MKIISVKTQIILSEELTEQQAMTLKAVSNLPTRNEYKMNFSDLGFTFVDTKTTHYMCDREPTFEALLNKVSFYKDITIFLP